MVVEYRPVVGSHAGCLFLLLVGWRGIVMLRIIGVFLFVVVCFMFPPLWWLILAVIALALMGAGD